MCEGYRHLPGHVFRVRVCCATGVCSGQLHILGRQGKEEKEGEENESKFSYF